LSDEKSDCAIAPSELRGNALTNGEGASPLASPVGRGAAQVFCNNSQISSRFFVHLHKSGVFEKIP